MTVDVTRLLWPMCRAIRTHSITYQLQRFRADKFVFPCVHILGWWSQYSESVCVMGVNSGYQKAVIS